MLTPTSCLLTRSDLAPKTLLNKSISSRKAQRRQRWSIPPSANIRSAEPMTNTITIDLVTLEKDFCFRVEASIAFSPKLIDTITQEAINHFQVQITNAVKHIDHICCCCG